MTRTRTIFTATGALAASFALGYLAGHRKPASVALKEKRSELQQQSTALKKTDEHTTTVANVTGNTTYRTRTIYYPTGKIIVQREGTRAEATQVKQDQQQQAEVRTEVVTKVETREVTKLVHPDPHRFILGARASLDTGLTGRVEPYAGLRLVGPIEVGASYEVLTKRPAAWVRLEWRF